MARAAVRLLPRSAAVVFLSIVVACGGGGGGSGGASSTSEPDSVGGAPVVTKADSPAAAARFLSQATFGPTAGEIDRVMAVQLGSWLDQEFAKPQAQRHLDFWHERLAAAPTGATVDWLYQSFWRNALTADDNLRQRVAFALSQLFVVSLNDANVSQFPRGVAHYFDTLAEHAFGNFRTLLEAVTLHPMMGLYLSHLKNRGDGGRVPDENYAREVMQLFTIGLHQLNPDGTSRVGSDGRALDAYGNEDVSGLAKVFTGWSWAGPDRSDSRFTGSGRPAFADRDITPMQPYPQFHADLPKTFLGTTCPGGVMPAVSLACALDRLASHPNTGPFFARQLIQRLVTSNPSPGYVARVAAVFADNGRGVRGDMKAVLRRLLLDPEARNQPDGTDRVFGKPREPLLRMTALLRAVGARSTSGQFSIGNTDNAADSLGQTAMRAPSVFNFWRPGYTPPNSELAAQGLVAPELQATNETSVAGYLNVVQSAIESGIGSGSPRDVQMDLAPLMAIAHDPDALLDRLELLLATGKLDPPTRDRIRGVVGSVALPVATSADAARRSRARVALFLVAAAPAFVIQR